MDRKEVKTYTQEMNGIKYSIKVDNALYCQSQLLWKTIHDIPIDEIKDGFKIEIGFSLYILQKSESGYDVVAPDYESTPFSEVTEDLTLAFLIQMEQLELLQKYHINGESIRFDDEIAVVKDSIFKPKICMQRFRELGGSGWCLNEISQREDGSFSNVESDEYESIYAYQLLNMRTSLLKVLMLPYDYLIVFDGDDIVEILNENDESILI